MKIDRIGFDTTGFLPIVALHTFQAHDGMLEHSIDGRLRATVPAEGFDDYARTWPDAAPVIEHIRAQPTPQQTVFHGAAGKAEAERTAQQTAEHTAQ